MNTKLDIPCDDAKSRILLEEFKSSCYHSGWYFETLRWTEEGFLIYKFFLLDLAEQAEIDGKKFVRYHGWVEAHESLEAINIKPAGDLENLLDSELKRQLLQRFYDDIVEPVCRRHKALPRFISA